MRNLPISLSTILCCIILCCATSACVPTLAGESDGSIAYVAGELQAQEGLSINDAWSATVRALQALELDVKEQDKDALSAKAVAYGADDKKVTVRLRRESAESTGVKIRVGLWGDKGFSLTILDKIEEEAGISPTLNAAMPSKPASSRGEPIPFKKRPLIDEAPDAAEEAPLEGGPAPAPRESLY